MNYLFLVTGKQWLPKTKYLNLKLKSNHERVFGLLVVFQLFDSQVVMKIASFESLYLETFIQDIKKYRKYDSGCLCLPNCT